MVGQSSRPRWTRGVNLSRHHNHRMASERSTKTRSGTRSGCAGKSTNPGRSSTLARTVSSSSRSQRRRRRRRPRAKAVRSRRPLQRSMANQEPRRRRPQKPPSQPLTRRLTRTRSGTRSGCGDRRTMAARLSNSVPTAPAPGPSPGQWPRKRLPLQLPQPRMGRRPQRAAARRPRPEVLLGQKLVEAKVVARQMLSGGEIPTTARCTGWRL
mmetsp:Transcript_81371/g.264117  ORF Transcript_81371/g.264117 Transcript_81371/m.264117 type:complete len:211 (-) Transcript_81371:249-881(-)